MNSAMQLCMLSCMRIAIIIPYLAKQRYDSPLPRAEFLISSLPKGIDFGFLQTELYGLEGFFYRLRNGGAIFKSPRLRDFLHVLFFGTVFFPSGLFLLKCGDLSQKLILTERVMAIVAFHLRPLPQLACASV